MVQDIIGRLNTKEYTSYMERDLLLNCCITKEDIIHAEDILGPNLGSLKGNTTCKTSSKVILNICDNLPEGLLKVYSDVIIVMDMMYINKIPFVITMSRAIHFRIAKII